MLSHTDNCVYKVLIEICYACSCIEHDSCYTKFIKLANA